MTETRFSSNGVPAHFFGPFIIPIHKHPYGPFLVLRERHFARHGSWNQKACLPKCTSARLYTTTSLAQSPETDSYVGRGLFLGHRSREKPCPPTTGAEGAHNPQLALTSASKRKLPLATLKGDPNVRLSDTSRRFGTNLVLSPYRQKIHSTSRLRVHGSGRSHYP